MPGEGEPQGVSQRRLTPRFPLDPLTRHRLRTLRAFRSIQLPVQSLFAPGSALRSADSIAL